MAESTNSVLILLGDSRLAMFEQCLFISRIIEHIYHLGVIVKKG